MGTAAHDTHASAETDGPLEHPVLPNVHDEASDTPTWVPVLGLAMLALLAAVWLLRAAAHESASEEVTVEVVPSAGEAAIQ
jgi:hypothetical protein